MGSRLTKINLFFLIIGLVLLGMGFFVSYEWIDVLILNPRGKLLLDWDHYVPMAIGTSFLFLGPSFFILFKVFRSR